MRPEGRQVTRRGNYIISSDRDRFPKAEVREARICTYHHMVLAVLQGEGALQNLRYVVGRTRWPLATPTVRSQTEGESAFASLKREVDRNQQPKPARAAWISKETWQLEDQR